MSKVEKIQKSDAEWKSQLTPEQYDILRKKGTERPFTCELRIGSGGGSAKAYPEGTYECVGCGLELFEASNKFDSGTGWPSFWQPVEGHIETEEDRAYGMLRTEVLCARCDGHLGHVFNDGPPPTGLRYCINGLVINFVPHQEAA